MSKILNSTDTHPSFSCSELTLLTISPKRGSIAASDAAYNQTYGKAYGSAAPKEIWLFGIWH